ncbi:MAG TPA: hypothetical protein PLX15_03125 [Candidatus Woesearchaeota archaeon]|nr:hypothetical protein [Candidatus Woesearchaeota archaeon]
MLIQFKNHYSYNKSIRFKLEHKNGKLPKLESDNVDLNKLVDIGNSLKDIFEELVYTKNNYNKLNSLVSIKKQWLKIYFKNEFYSNGKIQNYSLSNFSYLPNKLIEWLNNWQNNLKALIELTKQQDFNKTKKSEIAYILSLFNGKYSFSFVKDFSTCINHKNSQEQILKLQGVVENFEKVLNLCIQEYLPSKSAGVVIAQGSMNYYAINKEPKRYDNILADLNQKFEELDKEYIAMKQYKSSQKSRLFEFIRKGFSKDQILSEFKKKENNEVSFVYNNQIIIRIYTQELFKDSYCLGEVIKLTKKIEELNESKDSNNNLPEETKKEITKLKKEIGFYFIRRTRGKSHNNYFKSYYGFCNDKFKKKAQERGRLLTKIKAIRKEKIESQNLRYWSLILDDGKDKFLWLVPKENMQEFRRELSKIHPSGESSLFLFHSLTMRALHKLCFAQESDFVKEMPKVLKEEQLNCEKASNDTETNKRIKRNFGLNYIKTKDELTLSFLKKLIISEYAHERLDLNHFDLSKLQVATTLNEFEEYLEDACYYLEKISISSSMIKELLEEYNILNFRITSYDLEKRNKNTYQTPESDIKRHTKEIWNKFWEGDRFIRLNPEIKIRYRQKNQNIEDYLKEKGFDLTKIKNRFLQEQYSVSFTFALNAGKKYPKLAFVKTEEILEKIEEFNDEFNKQYFDNSYKYGIDRGNIELATLCITKFNKNDTYEYKGKKYLKPNFPTSQEDIKTYELKNEWYKRTAISNIETKPKNKKTPKRIIANISYFIDNVENEEWFNKKTCTSIDLTTAKVIKGKLILNGDVLTFLKLKKEAAKRILFELVAQNKLTAKNKELKWKSDDGNNSDSVRLICDVLDNETNSIYFYEDSKYGRGFEGLLTTDKTAYSKEGIRINLQNYLNHLISEKENKSNKAYSHVPSIEKINHLRDALVANMVGVISYLQAYYPGIVVLEDLNHKLLIKHFEDLNINISNRFEHALIEKFQTLGMVPPHIKDYLEIRSSFRMSRNDSSQFGALIFVSKEGTSKECPYCEKKWNWGKEKEIELKFSKKQYICGKENSCGFDTKHIQNTFEFLSEINDPDKIAAYNIAKRGFKSFINKSSIKKQ